jgi:hypothetical protein
VTATQNRETVTIKVETPVQISIRLRKIAIDRFYRLSAAIDRFAHFFCRDLWAMVIWDGIFLQSDGSEI